MTAIQSRSMTLAEGAVAPTGLRIRPQMALTFDDVLLVPRYSAIVSRRDTDPSSPFSRNIGLRIPIVSSNMDTVTESEMAIALARAGGIGVIHRFLTIRQQAAEVRRVKRISSFIITAPLTLPPSATVGDARQAMERAGVGGVIIVDAEAQVLGIVTRRDVMFADEEGLPLTTVMTGGERLITAPASTRFEEARAILHRHRVEKLPLVDGEGRLAGLIAAKDIEHIQDYPLATKDALGRLRVAAAVGVRPGFLDRAEALLGAGADALVVDIAHGDSSNAVEAALALRERFGAGWDLVVGNVATGEGAARLVDAGADAIKVGVGPGSICITRLVTGFGMPQLTAIAEAAAGAAGIPLIADGGIRGSGDVVKALAAGAQTVMIGSLLAGTKESPGMVVVRGGRRYKITRGMASLEATMVRDQKEDESQQQAKKEYATVVPEGVEARVPYRGPVADVLHQLVGGLRSGLSYAGARTVPELQANTEFVQITGAGRQESGPHDVDHG
ncbi:MAG: IMP dehydrogenase [Anaerolineae bacterium]|jgi:IMP dehydrogenase|nr:IMP dehydrogenase [Anaerolineae bacterium]HRA20052.1 IMP dehydrogenase [Anaerolineae bacterium]